MPKPILPSNLSAEMPVGIAAGRLLDAKRAEALQYVAPALTGDVDGIHDLRIAVKRLRETMRLLRPLFPRQRGKALLGLVEELNDGLGAVRDRDVLAEYATGLLAEAPESGEALAGLLETWAAERATALTDLASLWERLSQAEGLEARLRELGTLTRRRQRPANREPLDRFAYAAVVARLERVRLHLREAGDLREPSALHRLRILVKRLKYGIEPFLTALPALEGPYRPVAELQESLGLTHDFDILHAAAHEHTRRQRLDGKSLLALLATRRGETCDAALRRLEILRSPAWQHSVLDALD
jgi:CHAD domain-containing protein